MLLLAIGVGLIVWAVGMGMGGITGFAMNQARDLGPRLAYQLLPIKDKADNNWSYGLLVPGIAPSWAPPWRRSSSTASWACSRENPTYGPLRINQATPWVAQAPRRDREYRKRTSLRLLRELLGPYKGLAAATLALLS